MMRTNHARTRSLNMLILIRRLKKARFQFIVWALSLSHTSIVNRQLYMVLSHLLTEYLHWFFLWTHWWLKTRFQTQERRAFCLRICFFLDRFFISYGFAEIKRMYVLSVYWTTRTFVSWLQYKDIPAVGFSGTITSFISASRWLYGQAGVVRKGNSRVSASYPIVLMSYWSYQFPNGIFRYPTLTRWIVVVTKSKYVEELRKAPEDEVSASEAMKEVRQLYLYMFFILMVERSSSEFLLRLTQSCS